MIRIISASLAIIIALLASSVTTGSAQTWQRVGTDCEAVHVAPDGRMVVAGDFGSLLYSSDGGANWSMDSLGSTDDFVGLAFRGNDTGLAVGRTGSLARTYDGGRTWVDAGDAEGVDRVSKVRTVGQDRLLLLDEAGGILLSSDFGESWRPVASGYGRINGITSRSGVVAACGDSGLVLRSRDSGDTWERLPVPTRLDLNGVDLSEGSTLIAVGEKGTVLWSSNDGATWMNRSIPDTGRRRLLAVYRAGGRTLVGGGTVPYSGVTAYMSVDEGESWTSFMEPLLELFTRSVYDQEIRAFAAGSNGSTVLIGNHALIAVADSVLDWKVIALSPLYRADPAYDSFLLTGADFSTALTGTVVGAGYPDCPYLTTTNGGVTWLYDRLLAQGLISDVAYRDGREGLMVGENFVFESHDGGASWSDAFARLDMRIDNMQRLQFVSRDIGFIAGDTMVFRTTDGGKNWRGTVIPGSQSLVDVHFVSETTGFASSIGFQSIRSHVYRTTDGALSWQQVFETDPIRALHIHFIDALRGFAVGGLDQFYRTLDGGATWDTVVAPGIGISNDVLFIDSLVGYVVGLKNASLLKTEDGGLTWNRVRIWESNARDSSIVLGTLAFNPMSGQLLIGGPGLLAIGQVAQPRAAGTGPELTYRGAVGNQYLHISAAPNPLGGTSQRVRLSGLYSVKGESVRLALYDLLGRKVSDATSGLSFDANGATASADVDYSAVPNGNYFLQLTAGRYVLTERVVVMRE